MDWVELTSVVLVAGLVVWICWDVVAFARGGNKATFSRLLLDTSRTYPYFAIGFAFVLGLFCGHAFIPQHVTQ